ncbi:hypothetical protein PROVRETT_06475 [Providencia rettgeri DSM 1131]|nr:hypothetical protein PROVRETT_06475 [Providencia rettgeri DSM 1131]
MTRVTERSQHPHSVKYEENKGSSGSIHKYVTRVTERSQHPHNAKYEENDEN